MRSLAGASLRGAPRIFVWFWCLCWLLTAAAPDVKAQAAVEATFEGDLSPEQRNALYASLSHEADELERGRRILKTVVKLVSPTVVHIEAEKHEPAKGYGRGRLVEEAGSGVVIELKDSFYVLTNRHVIRDAQLQDIKIRMADGHVAPPVRVWADQDTDIAVMAIKAPHPVPARLGNSDRVEIGDFVLAVGSPFGLSHSVTYGIISAKGRRDLELGDGGVRYQDFMQTDAAINPGNSGGPLINLRGEVIGINTAIASNSGGNEGIGFSIPINLVMVIARQLIDHGSVNRAYLGVSLDSKFTSALAQELGLPRKMGARIVEVKPGSPAETGQLQVGDVITQFNGVRVEDDTHLVNIISFTEVGAEVPIIIYRNRRPMQMTIKVGSKPPQQQASYVPPR
ncbi:MAG TPA: trypsin-like peptidase domain-containing protein [Pirellulales bacterium]|jgi:serine protease Do|nr:trypsin-like peptidase domain-containing protein [Pirellulales bacterium]